MRRPCPWSFVSIRSLYCSSFSTTPDLKGLVSALCLFPRIALTTVIFQFARFLSQPVQMPGSGKRRTAHRADDAPLGQRSRPGRVPILGKNSPSHHQSGVVDRKRHSGKLHKTWSFNARCVELYFIGFSRRCPARFNPAPISRRARDVASRAGGSYVRRGSP